MAADFALGKADLISSGIGTGSGVLAGAQTVHAADGQLIVNDTGNHRVLFFEGS